ncbi:MerR family transcriptional regulator [Sphaerisporangium melleum]|uniref:MerR family transcriptional regulator n=1 Tax=Sphaerisporangium melleum TaxID=321316 RepID=A0A917R515_9ACTN|nr:MerR family transcriptional regulator [Sphaerisporangium melleum]GGK90982.1 MerR family transcriptional regulator [Sphaerisporangium melleum]GII72795.1 MerR family transcriptional regulator [Sphaerisporangium melleum]
MGGGGTGAGLRPVDLARLAGVSPQQIRNYADDGILPPVPRTPAGHRRFGEEHRAAMLTYRALAPGFGWEEARAIMQAVHAGHVPRALEMMDAGHAALHEQRRSLRATGAALEAVAAQDAAQDEVTPQQGGRARATGQDGATAQGGGREARAAHGNAAQGSAAQGSAAQGSAAQAQRGLRVGEVAALLGVRTSALRLWESAGLLAPRREQFTGYRRYGPADVRDARMIDMLRRGRYPLPQIKEIIEGLRRTGGSEALRTAIARRQGELTRRAAAMLQGASHLHAYLTATGAMPGMPETAAAR